MAPGICGPCKCDFKPEKKKRNHNTSETGVAVEGKAVVGRRPPSTDIRSGVPVYQLPDKKSSVGMSV
jgi:hypothetical protein